MELITNYLQEIDIEKINENFIKSIGKDWMLITASNASAINPMTASWGGMGVLWHKPVAICFIRPTRYTYELIENTDAFSLCFLPESDRKILNICGSTSGRDSDKIASTGLEPLLTPHEGIGYKQSRLCIDCKTIYTDDLKPEKFLPEDIDSKIYPKKDYHRMYIGEIIGSYITR